MKKLFKYILLNSVLLLLPLTAQAAYYKWTDTKGEIHYSNSVPPSVSQLGHIELNKQGVKQKEVVSAKRKKQLQLLEIQRIKQKKIEAKNLVRRRLVEAEDSRLLYVFNNEAELTESYNAKLRLAQITIDLLKSRHKVQSAKLEALEKRHERTVLVLQKSSLEKQINDVLDNLKIYQQAITENIVEKDKVRKDYNATLNRFKRLITESKKIAKKKVK